MTETAAERPDDSPLQIILLETWMRQNLNQQLRLNPRFTSNNHEAVADAVSGDL